MNDTLKSAITAALDYVTDNTEIPADVWQAAIRRGVLKAGGGLAAINARYHNAITESLLSYLEGGAMTGPKNRFKKAMIEAFGSAADLGWKDGGGEGAFDGEALEWFNARTEQELSFIDGLFVQAKELRKEEDFDRMDWVNIRADGYTQTLASIYNAMKMFAQKSQLLTWQYGDTEHCKTCEKLNGQRHRAAWYIARDFIPGKPGAAMDCGSYRCKCSLIDKNGKAFTI